MNNRTSTLGATTEGGVLRIQGEILIPNAEGGQWPPERIIKLLDTIQQIVEAAEFTDGETQGLPSMVFSGTTRLGGTPVTVHVPYYLINVARAYPAIDWNEIMRHACRYDQQQGGNHDRQKGDEEVARTPQTKGQQP